MYRLIIADDERMVIQGIKKSLPWKDLEIIEVELAENGQELMEKSKAFQPDIAIVDIHMPKMNGLECIQRLKVIVPSCCFIILTAYADFEYAKRAIDLGVLAYITKPIMRAEIIENIKKAVMQLKSRQGRVETGMEPPHDSQISRLKKYLQSHVDAEISLRDAAEYMHMNASYLSRYFRERTKVSFSDYVKGLKIARAEYLLSTTSMKTYEISDLLGYKSVQYFSKLFKEATGMTPMEYRNNEEDR